MLWFYISIIVLSYLSLKVNDAKEVSSCSREVHFLPLLIRRIQKDSSSRTTELTSNIRRSLIIINYNYFIQILLIQRQNKMKQEFHPIILFSRFNLKVNSNYNIESWNYIVTYKYSYNGKYSSILFYWLLHIE